VTAEGTQAIQLNAIAHVIHRASCGWFASDANEQGVTLDVTLICGRTRFRTWDPCRVKAVLYR
jgi:hypothetical protein